MGKYDSLNGVTTLHKTGGNTFSPCSSHKKSCFRDDAYLLPMLGLLIAVWALLYAPYAAADLIRKRRE